jgi:glycosyltransferase involved in cell wall biosynthesis
LAFLLDAFANLLRAHPGCTLTIVGDGVLVGELGDKVQRLGLQSSVQILGAKPNDEIPGILRAHQVAVMPDVVAADGDQEGLGLNMVEAMGCGCAVIASDLPAIRDVVRDGETGLLVPQKNVEALSQAMCYLMDHPAVAKELSEKGRRHAVDNFDWTVVTDNYLSIYRRLNQPCPG